MKLWHRAGRLLASCVVTLFVLALAPAVLLAGELVNRHYLGGLPPGRDRILVRRRWLPGRRRVAVRNLGPGRAAYAAATRDHRVARRVLANPLWIALTAPARWLLDRIRPHAGGRRGRGGNGPPGAGVREPRRPLPDLPAGAMALPEPGPFD
jgi:hypothetical protein